MSDKRAMTLKFLFRRKMRASGPRLADCHGPGRFRCTGDASGVGDQAEADLAAAGQLDIDLREQLRVEQRAMLDALAAVDAEPRAQGVEAVLGTGVPGCARARNVSTIRLMQTDGPAAALQLDN